jgi:predicted RNase H-like nuclease (RuvC/YqgF family)
MGFFGTTRADEHGNPGAGPVPAASPPPADASSAKRPRVGIDHAISLVRSLPTEDENLALVVTVLKRTLESLDVNVADIVADATARQHEIDRRSQQLRAEIAQLDQEIARRSEEIDRLDSARAEASKVKEYLEMEFTPGNR